MNYLENMGENLELLDLVKKCNVTTYSLRSIRDKNTAIKNLKGLRVELLRVSDKKVICKLMKFFLDCYENNYITKPVLMNKLGLLKED